MALLDPVLEDKADDTPGEIVERCGRRNSPGAAKDERGHEVADGGLGPPLGSKVEDDG